MALLGKVLKRVTTLVAMRCDISVGLYVSDKRMSLHVDTVVAPLPVCVCVCVHFLIPYILHATSPHSLFTGLSVHAALLC